MNASTVRALIPFAIAADGALVTKVFLGYTDPTMTVIALVSYGVVAVTALVWFYRNR